MAPARNVCVEGVWYGPDYPEAGDPPADKVDAKFLGRKAADDVEPVGWAAVTTPEQAGQFGGGAAVPVDDTPADRDVPDVDPPAAADTGAKPATRGRK